MRFEFVENHREEYPIQRMCAVLEVSASGYYAWRRRTPSRREMANQELVAEIKTVHLEYRQTYGSPRMQVELVARGFSASENRVARLMRKHNIRARRKRKRPTSTNSRHDHPIAAHVLKRDFGSETPNRKWLSDITYIPTAEGWLYLAAVLDLYSRKIVGWAMEASLETRLVERAFEMAVQNRNPSAGLLHHSDRGSQYASGAYQTLLLDQKMQVSMSRTANCYDNAPMESFFSTLKCEWVHHQNYQTRQEAKTDIFGYIEEFYNR